MLAMFNLNQSMTVTGFIILILGMLTVTPEIFFSGAIVMVVSSTQGIHQLDTLRANELNSQPVREAQHASYEW